jgi:putative membrane-bound dehydrogenase-like protein
MTVPAGFAVELVAAEPLVRQPVAIDFDDRGRLWVIQYLQYPNPAGLARVTVDRFSRTRYDKIPEPPPKGPRGEDRLTILEPDPDRPGKLRGKDFVSGLNLASGFAFGQGGVFVLNPPYLLFYADHDRNDVPDADPEVLLTGFGMDDAHSVANSLTWGPDGWLYGCQGSTVTASIRGIEFQQGVWRYHPRTKEFELFCEGGGNSWGLDFDRHGNLLYSTNNGGYVMLHGVQGAYLWKQFGKHGELHNPHAYGYFDHVPHENFQGGHVTVGGIVYRGGAFPASFEGKYIAGDLLGHGVYWHDIEPRGTTFRTRHGGELLIANDTWFATSDVCLGPDGCVYVADWSDARTAHPDPDATWDRSNGRIYRIAYGDYQQPAAFDLNNLSSQDLQKLLSHRNHWFAVRARRILAERRDPALIPSLLAQVRKAKEDEPALEALWALNVSGGWSEVIGRELLSHQSQYVRSWTVRLLGDTKQVETETSRMLAEMAAKDESPLFRSQLACTARRLPAHDALPILKRLLVRNLDDADPYIPLLLWWAVETHALQSQAELVSFLTTDDHGKIPLIQSFILPRLVRRYAAEGTEATDESAAKLLAAAAKDALPPLVAALELGLQARPSAARQRLANPLREWLQTEHKQRADDLALMRILVRAGDDGVVRSALAKATDPRGRGDDRVSLLQALPQSGAANLSPAVAQLLAASEPEPIRLAALSALGQLGADDTPANLFAQYPQMTDRLKAAARSALLGRKAWAAAALAAVESGKLPAKDFTPDELRLVAEHGDRALDDLVRKHWGTVGPGTPEEKLAEVRRLNNDLRAASGDAKVGKTLFTKHCASCHKLFTEGATVGPDLTFANRTDRDYLLVSLVDPSSVIRKEFLTYSARLDDGQVVSGLIAEQGAQQVTFFNAKAEKVLVPRSSIEELRESAVSLMPDNLYREFKPQELRDLFAYLQAKNP